MSDAAPKSDRLARMKHHLQSLKATCLKHAEYNEALKRHMNTGGPDDLPPRDPSSGILSDIVSRRMKELPEAERQRIYCAATEDLKRIFSK